MFTDFERPAGNIFRAPVNSLLGGVFLGTCALWGAMFIWNISTGENPIDHAISAAIDSQVNFK